MKHDYSAFVFDLDGTLTVSKSPVTPEVCDFLRALLQKGKTVGVISGGRMSQFEQQFLNYFSCEESLLEHLYLMPTSGAALYVRKDGAWHEQYAHRIPREEYERILGIFDTIFEQTSFPRPVPQWGEQIEYRDTQVTFSALGQKAPVEEKKKWDKDGRVPTRKQEIADLLAPHLPEYNIKTSSNTSVDITLKGIDKKYGTEEFLQRSGHTVAETLFVGDGLYEGGNDYAVIETGVDTLPVEGPADLLQKLSAFA